MNGLGVARAAHALVAPVRSERAMTLLDWLRHIGPLTTDECRQVLAHATTSNVNRYLRDLEAEGLVARRPAAHGLCLSWEITEHGRGVA